MALMTESFTSLPETPSIHGFAQSMLPWIDFASPLVLLIGPMLYFTAIFLIDRTGSRRLSTKQERGLFSLIAALFLFSAVTATFNGAVQGRGWLTVSAIASLVWPLAMATTVCVGYLRTAWVATVFGAAVATYYVVFPISYTVMQGLGLLGPGIREMLIVTSVAVISTRGSAAARPARFRVAITVLVFSVISIFAATSLRTYYYHSLAGRAF